MSEAWNNHPDEYAAGIAYSIDKVWNSVNDLYAAADLFDADAGKPWTLPIYGGRPVAHGVDADPTNPPLMVLEPTGVSQAAVFLAAVSFDALWNVAGSKIGGFGEGKGEGQARQEFFEHHGHLRRFYGRAASAGQAVVKAVWA